MVLGRFTSTHTDAQLIAVVGSVAKGTAHGFVGHFAPTSGNMIDRELRLKVLAGIPEARVEDGRWGCPFPCGCLPSA